MKDGGKTMSNPGTETNSGHKMALHIQATTSMARRKEEVSTTGVTDPLTTECGPTTASTERARTNGRTVESTSDNG